MVDVGQIFGNNVDAAAARLPVLQQLAAVWLEEPFHTGALASYAELSRRSPVPLAGGEGAHNFYMAQHFIDYGRVRYIQVDTGRIGGIGPAKRVADYAASTSVNFVNHTFTSHLALSASLQAYAGLRSHEICEYPFNSKALARELTANRLDRDQAGYIAIPETPGLGIEIDLAAAKRYLMEVEIRAKGCVLFRSSDQNF